MLDVRSHSQLAEATAGMMRACALATARAASAPVFQGMSFWSWMLRTSAARPACKPTPNAQTEQAQTQAEPPTEPAFSSYRSSGGHAVAQVIVG